MRIAELGRIAIEVTPNRKDPKLSDVTMHSETRGEMIESITQPDETLDQFAKRLRSMLTSLYNAPQPATAGKK